MCTKRALRRRPDYPVGTPAPLYLVCGCGKEIDIDPEQVDNTCETCGTIYDGLGWIVQPAE